MNPIIVIRYILIGIISLYLLGGLAILIALTRSKKRVHRFRVAVYLYVIQKRQGLAILRTQIVDKLGEAPLETEIELPNDMTVADIKSLMIVVDSEQEALNHKINANFATFNDQKTQAILASLKENEKDIRVRIESYNHEVAFYNYWSSVILYIWLSKLANHHRVPKF